MSYNPNNPNGQALSANSAPVVIASNQTALPVIGSQGTIVTAAWTSATALSSTVSVPTSNYNTVSVAMSNTSSMTGGVLTFEVSPNSTDGTNGTWFPIAMARIDSYTVETIYTLNTIANRSWSTSVDALWSYFRIRLSTIISGTGTASLFLAPQAFAIEPIVSVGQATASNLNANVSGTITAANTVGNVTSGSGDSGNPVKVGGIALTANPTAVANAARVNFIADKLGKQVVVGSIRDLKANSYLTLTASTTETSLITAIAATFNDIYGLIIENTSATGTEVIFRDSLAGTTQFSVFVPAADTRGFMLPESGAIKQTTVNTAWTAQCTTAVSSIKISALYVKNI